MKMHRPSPLPLFLALTIGGAALACSQASSPDTGDKGSGGSDEPGAGGTGAGGKEASGGKPGAGGKGGGSAMGGEPGAGGSGDGGSASGGSGGAQTGSGGAQTGSGGAEAGGAGGAQTQDAGAPDMPPAGGKMMITIDYDKTTSTPTRLCFKPEAGHNFPGGGDRSPKIDWTPPPPGTMSLVEMMEDLSNTPTPHQVVCNMMPTETGRPADAKASIPAGAMAGTGHGKPMDRWYGPGADVRNYEITIFALATPKLAVDCGPGSTPAKAARDYLKKNKNNKAIVLDYDSKILWGSADGKCK